MWRRIWPVFDGGIMRRMMRHREPRRRAMQAAARLVEGGTLQPGERVWVVRCKGMSPFSCWSDAYQALAARSVREAWAQLESQGWYLQRTRPIAGIKDRPVCPDCVLRWLEVFALDTEEVDERHLAWAR